MTNLKEKITDSKKVVRGNDFYKWVAYILGSIAHLFNFFHRVTTSVLAPYLVETFKISSTNLGFMSSVYFYSYAALQPVVGVLTDRWKPRKMLTISVATMTLGTFIFAYSPSFIFTYLGRLLIGIGSAGIFVPVSWIITNYFSFSKRGFLFAILIFCANIGSTSAASPFAKLITYFGWRNALANIAFTSFALAVLVWLLVRDDNSNKMNVVNLNNKDKKIVIKTDKEKNSWFVVCRKIVSIPIVKYCFFNSITYAAMISFQGLWAVPFFMDVYKMDKSTASDIVTLIPLGFLVGVIVLSKLNDTKYGRYIFFLVNTTSLISFLIFTIFTVNLPNTVVMILLFLIGFSNSAVPFLFKVYSLVFPKRYYGTALGIVNMFPFILSALYQSVTGLIFDLSEGGVNVLQKSVGSYRLYFLILTISLVVATLARVEMIKILNKDYKGKI